MDTGLVSFVAGAVIGFAVAAIIGRGKFLQVQNQLRATKEYLEGRVERLIEELEAKTTKTRTRRKS